MDDEVSDAGRREGAAKHIIRASIHRGGGGETAGVVHAQGKALKGEWEAINTER